MYKYISSSVNKVIMYPKRSKVILCPLVHLIKHLLKHLIKHLVVQYFQLSTSYIVQMVKEYIIKFIDSFDLWSIGRLILKGTWLHDNVMPA